MSVSSLFSQHLPIGDALSGWSRSRQRPEMRPCRDMIAAMLKSVAQGRIVQLSSIISAITAIHDTFYHRSQWAEAQLKKVEFTLRTIYGPARHC